MTATIEKPQTATAAHPLQELHQMLLNLKNEENFRMHECTILEELERAHEDGYLIPVVAERLKREAAEPFRCKRGLCTPQKMASTLAEIIRSSSASAVPRPQLVTTPPPSPQEKAVLSTFIDIHRRALLLKGARRPWSLGDFPTVFFPEGLTRNLEPALFRAYLHTAERCSLDGVRYSRADLLGSVLLLLAFRGARMKSSLWKQLRAMEWHPQVAAELFTSSGQPTARFLALLCSGAAHLSRFGLRHRVAGNDPDDIELALFEQCHRLRPQPSLFL